MTAKLINGLTPYQRHEIYTTASIYSEHIIMPIAVYYSSYSLGWHVMLGIKRLDRGHWFYEQITRCEHEQSARDKVAAIQAFLMKPKVK